ncbi:hypothetical protein QBA35_37325 [Streptomyces bottropensis]|uniref:Uncharacterized protein n=1 Tax=Streptomyces bottropensis TaxID=42235 RepID=A0ABU8AYT8_9ACTN
MTSKATPEVRIALSFHSLRSCASGRVFRLGGRVVRAAIPFSLARARSETTGRNFSSPSSSTAVTYSCSRSSRQAAIWSLRRAVQRISSCGTPAISITGRRPAVTMRGSVASPSASQTSAATISL